MHIFSASLALGLATSVTARYLPRDPNQPAVYTSDLASRQAGGLDVSAIQQSADGSVPHFAYEDKTLDTSKLSSVFEHGAIDVTGSATTPPNYTLAGTNNCKVFPGDLEWPSDDDWEALDSATDGPLLKPLPQAHICYSNGTGISVDNATCQAMTSSWTDPFFHTEDPIEMLSPLYGGMTCQPPSIFTETNTCTQGGYPVYVVNATNVADIQAAVNFARNTGIRLVIKNTGHDFAGKSAGAGSLSIWTHHFKELAFLPDYSSSEYTGPAIKAGVGIQGYELYAAADKLGVVGMGGECPTVGVTGGWLQGGGHSPVSSLWGMGADQALGFEVVTSDGQFVTANKDTNADLYWALRGGGGGNFGVVTSVVMKVHYDVSISAASWTFATGGNVTAEQFKAGMKAYFETFPEGADNGIYAYFKIFNRAGSMSFSMQPYFAPGKDMAETKALLAPWISQMEVLKIPLDIKWQEFDSFYTAYNASFPVGNVNNQGVATASRMFPRENWANETIWNATFDGMWSSLEAGNALIGYNIAPSWERGGYTNAPVNPAWRNAISFIITGVVTDMTKSWAEQLEQRQNFTDTVMQDWRDLTPGSGSYLSEADRLEPNFQWAFWGSFYPKLLEVKKKYDPYNLFYAAQSVGSEFFEVRTPSDGYPGENGKLCVNPSPTLYVAEGPDYSPSR